MSAQNDDMADTRPIKIASQQTKKSTEPPVWLVGSGILLLSFCLAAAMVVDFLTLKGYLTWRPIIPVAQAAPANPTPFPATATVNNTALPTSTPPAATAPVNNIVGTIVSASTATPTQPGPSNMATAAPITVFPPNSTPGYTYSAADCANLAPDLLFVISETGKPWAQTAPANKLDAFEFQPALFQQISAAKPLCAQDIVFKEINNACTPTMCLVETGTIIFPDAATAKTMFILIDQSYQSMAKNKVQLNWPMPDTNAASCFSESSPTSLRGSAIRCTTLDGNSVLTSIMVSGDPFGQAFANAAKQMFLNNLQK
jgi:hypothetical protein